MFKGLMKLIGMLAWFLASVGAIHHALVGLAWFDLLKTGIIPVVLHPYVYYAFGISGLITLLWFFKVLLDKGCRCDCEGHKH